MNTAKIVVGIIHILLSIIMIALILLQSGKRAGMAGLIGGAADTFYSKNKSRTIDAIFARFTKVCAIAFLVTSLFLAYGDNFVKTETTTPTTTEAPAEVVPSSDASQIPTEEVAPETVPSAEATVNP